MALKSGQNYGVIIISLIGITDSPSAMRCREVNLRGSKGPAIMSYSRASCRLCLQCWLNCLEAFNKTSHNYIQLYTCNEGLSLVESWSFCAEHFPYLVFSVKFVWSLFWHEISHFRVQRSSRRPNMVHLSQLIRVLIPLMAPWFPPTAVPTLSNCNISSQPCFTASKVSGLLVSPRVMYPRQGPR